MAITSKISINNNMLEVREMQTDKVLFLEDIGKVVKREKEELIKILESEGVARIDAQKIAEEILYKAEWQRKFEGIKEIVQINRELSGGHILHSQVADALYKRFKFISLADSGEILMYVKGIYEDAEAIVAKIIEDCLEGHEKVTRHFVEEVLGHIRRKFPVKRTELNQPKTIIPVQNGLLDLETFELREFSPDFYFTFKLPIWYDPDADCPKFKQFLSEVLYEEDIPTMQEFFGYCLWRDYNIQKAFMLVGEGSNGKSTLLSVLKRFLGAENVTSIAIQTLERDRFAIGSLFGKLANIYADLPDKALYSTGTFKMLTGGDSITADKKFREPFTFTNYAKLIFSANKLPEVRDNTDAFFRRWIIINFPNVFDEEKADKNLLQKLTTEEELSGILNWAIEGLKRLLERGYFSNTKSTDELRDAYIRMSNPLQAFVLDYVKEDPEGWIPKDEFYAKYVEYCKKNKLTIKAKNIVAKELQGCLNITINVERRETPEGRVRGWKGISWKEPEEDKEDNVTLSDFTDNGQGVQYVQENSLSYTSLSGTNLKLRKNLDMLDNMDTNITPLIQSIRTYIKDNGEFNRDNWAGATDLLDKALEKMLKSGEIIEVKPGLYKFGKPKTLEGGM